MGIPESKMYWAEDPSVERMASIDSVDSSLDLILEIKS